jgi:hypothetical protein
MYYEKLSSLQQRWRCMYIVVNSEVVPSIGYDRELQRQRCKNLRTHEKPSAFAFWEQE